MAGKRFYIAFENTKNEQIYDSKNRVVIWTTVDRRVLDVEPTVDDGNWRAL